MIKIGERIKFHRKRKGLTISQLASNSGCNQATISELESGNLNNPSARIITGLSKALSVSTDELLIGTKPQKEGNKMFFRKYETLSYESKIALEQVLEELDSKHSD